MYYVVKYEGPFGYIKPWTAVRDKETFSQQFLTPSIIEGMRQKLGVSAVLRHKLTYAGMSRQQEVTETRGWTVKKRDRRIFKSRSILDRLVLLAPTLYLAFPSEEDAQQANIQHLCLCRNEDLVMPRGNIQKMTEEEFDAIEGFELQFGEYDDSFMVGFNRFEENAPMYGRLEVSEKPLKNYDRL